MADEYSEVSTESYGERILSSIGGAILGVGLFLGSFVLLWWNEGNVVAERKAIEEVREALVVGNDVKSPQEDNDGKVLYLRGSLAGESLGDEFIKAGSYLALDRRVEMYQWVEESREETETKLGGSTETKTTYTYTLAWHDGRLDSNSFAKSEGHENPELPVEAAAVLTEESSFGAYDGQPVLERLPIEEPLPVTSAMLNAKSFYNKNASIEGGKIRLQAGKGGAPALGDIRISYSVIKPGTVSVIAQQDDVSTLVPYMTQQGKEKFIVQAGRSTPQAMLKAEKDAANTMAYLLRAGGFFAMWIGLCLIAAPLSTIADFLPFLGSASRMLTGVVAGAIAFVLSATTIVLGMLFYHPLALVGVVAVLGAAYAYYHLKIQKKQPADEGRTIARKNAA